MELTEQQRAAVKEWVAAGESLNDIQKRLKTEFGVHITYFDLRMLVLEMPQPAEPEPPAEVEPEAPAEMPADELPAGEDGEQRYDVPPPEEGGEGEKTLAANVVVDMDSIAIPGVMASGGVTFSDGTTAKWYLDQMGRLGLGDAPEGFRPSPADAALFQTRLMELLRSRGMM